jgi:glycosyltransferase involved in cell wall biosynthesis
MVCPLITVVIPTYNRLWGLKKAVDSILGQDAVSWIIQIVDDGCESDALDHVNGLKDPRIRYFRQEKNVGVSRNWIHGINLVETEYCCLLMDDDWYCPSFLSSRLEILKANKNIGLVYGPYKRWEKNKIVEKVILPKYSGLISNSELNKAMLIRDNFIGSTMFRSGILKSIVKKCENTGLIIDYPLSVYSSCFSKCDGFVISENNFNYLNHTETLSNLKTEIAWEQTFHFLKELQSKGLIDNSSISSEIYYQSRVHSRLAKNYLSRILWGCRSIRAKPFYAGGYFQLIKNFLLID